jgi:hypothetical protein
MLKLKRLLLFLAVGFLAACSTPNAAYQRGVFAGQAESRIKVEAAALATIAQENIQARRAYEIRDLNEALGNSRDRLARMKDTQRAVSEALSIGIDYQRKVDSSFANRESDLANVASHQAGLEFLAQTPVDVSKMADAEEEAVKALGKFAAGEVARAGVAAAAAYTATHTPPPAPAPVQPAEQQFGKDE